MIHVQIILMGFGQSAGDADAGIKRAGLSRTMIRIILIIRVSPRELKLWPNCGGGDELTQYVMVSHRLVVVVTGLEGHADDQATGGE